MVVQFGSSDLYSGKRWRWVVVEGTEILDLKTSGKTRSLLQEDRENRKKNRIEKALPLLMVGLVGSVRWEEMEMGRHGGRQRWVWVVGDGAWQYLVVGRAWWSAVAELGHDS
jgi:hypothetical protein